MKIQRDMHGIRRCIGGLRPPFRARSPAPPKIPARSAKRHCELADREAVRSDAWYVLAASDSVDHHISVRAFGHEVRVWREADGSPRSDLRFSDGGAPCRCTEAMGFVWAFYGDPSLDPPAIPFADEVGNTLSGGARAVTGSIEISANHWMVEENIVDTAHVPFVHGATVGDHAAFHSLQVERDHDEVRFSFPIDSHARIAAKALRVNAKAAMRAPATAMIEFQALGGLRLTTLNCVVPVDGERTRVHFCQMRTFLHVPLVDALVRRAMLNILGEDKAILESLRPYEVMHEISIAADEPALALRAIRAKLPSSNHHDGDKSPPALPYVGCHVLCTEAEARRMTAKGPRSMRVAGRPIVLWQRLDGELVAMDDACCHRAAPLSDGEIVTVVDPSDGSKLSCIQCPYHHIAFSADGRIASVPTDDGTRRWPKRPLQKTHDMAVEDGHVVITMR